MDNLDSALSRPCRRDIAGAERFEELGDELAELLPPDDWEEADEHSRRVLTRRLGSFVRMFNGLDASDLTFEDLPVGVFGEHDPWTDLVTISEILLQQDDPV